MKTRSEVLREVQVELTRFQSKLKEAIDERKDTFFTKNGDIIDFSSKKFASAKRAALDLKNELTKLTQDTKYRYE